MSITSYPSSGKSFPEAIAHWPSGALRQPRARQKPGEANYSPGSAREMRSLLSLKRKKGPIDQIGPRITRYPQHRGRELSPEGEAQGWATGACQGGIQVRSGGEERILTWDSGHESRRSGDFLSR